MSNKTNLKPFEVLDNHFWFYEDREVSELMRQLYRMGYEEGEAKRTFKSWISKRGHKIIDVSTVEEME